MAAPANRSALGQKKSRALLVMGDQPPDQSSWGEGEAEEKGAEGWGANRSVNFGKALQSDKQKAEAKNEMKSLDRSWNGCTPSALRLKVPCGGLTVTGTIREANMPSEETGEQLRSGSYGLEKDILVGGITAATPGEEGGGRGQYFTTVCGKVGGNEGRKASVVSDGRR